MRRRAATGLVLAVCASAAAAAPAGACTVAVPPGYDPVRDPYARADIAVTGKVTRVERTRRGRDTLGDRFVATIRISRVYKGRTGPALRIRGHEDEGACGFGRIRQGERIALLLRGRRTPIPVGLGDRTSYRDLETASGGRSHRPGRR